MFDRRDWIVNNILSNLLRESMEYVFGIDMTCLQKKFKITRIFMTIGHSFTFVMFYNYNYVCYYVNVTESNRIPSFNV
jgi:hypothetical protein